jgi:hypothetical protein
MTEIKLLNNQVTIFENTYEYESIEQLDDIHAHLHVSDNQVFLLTADFVKVNEVLQTSVEMMIQTFTNAKA